jgi:hypothetical protein
LQQQLLQQNNSYIYAFCYENRLKTTKNALKQQLQQELQQLLQQLLRGKTVIINQ